MVRLAGATIQDAVKMASLTPARLLKMSHRKGILAKGMDADIVIFDDNFEVKTTIVNGKIVKKG
jgi:N-acetylglucosamine-6-phosphate deacetylase